MLTFTVKVEAGRQGWVEGFCGRPFCGISYLVLGLPGDLLCWIVEGFDLPLWLALIVGTWSSALGSPRCSHLRAFKGHRIESHDSTKEIHTVF